jgi:hypothetical protein
MQTINFNDYVLDELKQVYPTLTISSEAVEMLVDIIQKTIILISESMTTILNEKQKSNITLKTVQSAVRQCFPGELATHAVSAGIKVSTYYVKSDITPKKIKGIDIRTLRAGVLLSVKNIESRVRSLIPKELNGRKITIKRDVPIYLVAVLEYLIGEILELTGYSVKNQIELHDLKEAIENDSELDQLVKNLRKL